MRPFREPARHATLIGAPTDVGAGVRGASMGPEALRIAGIRRELTAVGVAVDDLGDLRGPPNPECEPAAGYRHLDEVIAWNRAVHDAVAGVLRAGRLPLLLGGDHCLAMGSIGAVADHCRTHGRKLRILWLDAHADFNTAALTPSGNMHGMPLACLCGLGPEALSRVDGRTAIHPGWVRQIGVRSVDDGERRLLATHGVEVFDMRAIDEHGMRVTMERALSGIDADTHLHVSFDVDFLDASIAPGVGTSVAGGPTYREARLCMEMIADTGLVGSVDIMELNPALDHANRTAEVTVELMATLFGRRILLPASARPTKPLAVRDAVTAARSAAPVA